MSEKTRYIRQSETQLKIGKNFSNCADHSPLFFHNDKNYQCAKKVFDCIQI